MTAEQAWQEWDDAHHRWGDDTMGKEAFFAGYRAALEDAADAVDQTGVAFYDAYGIALSTSEWLRARAAAVGKDDA